ncbi:MAG TPA: hypothetical protein VFO34_15200 [Candidatus Acidoferrales bacterium]|nr:hypothetical protein [Candidatus Acidoferrales bacterium]
MTRLRFLAFACALCAAALVSSPLATISAANRARLLLSPAASWITHNDPAGFSVDLPPDWNVSKDAATGRIVMHGTQNEQVVIWPVLLQHVQLDARAAATLLKQLAQRSDPQMSWSAAQPVQGALRVIASSGELNAAAMLSWAASADGTSAYFYCLEAPPQIYRSSTDTFVGILKSFHIVQDPSMKNLGAAPGAVNFVNWNDPHEGAFSVAVPQGWQIIGGAYRLSATDVRYAVSMGSPDGQVRAAVGDSSIGGFIQPSQMLAMAGLREGGMYMLGDGSKLEIRRYIDGASFARLYAQNFISRQCSGLQVTSSNPRQDLAATFLQAAHNEGARGAYLTAGDASFTCTLNGRPAEGKYIAATVNPQPTAGTVWLVYRLYGYIALAARELDAQKVVTQAMQTWKFNPQWEAQQRNTANAAVQQDNIRSQQIRQRAMQAIAEDQRQTSETIMKGWEDRQKIYDEVSRRQENAILGTLDVVDPQTGARYKVSNFGDYHYMSNDGYIYSTNVPGAPAPNLREMITLPY